MFKTTSAITRRSNSNTPRRIAADPFLTDLARRLGDEFGIKAETVKALASARAGCGPVRPMMTRTRPSRSRSAIGAGISSAGSRSDLPRTKNPGAMAGALIEG